MIRKVEKMPGDVKEEKLEEDEPAQARRREGGIEVRPRRSGD